jgi:ubiquinone/menaquinone biosynthesis C-methylase UbiE
MKKAQEDEIREAVRRRYSQAARQEASCCGCAPSCCGGETSSADHNEISARLGYSEKELSSIPHGANLGLGCGNPQAIAALKPGEVVLDLGAGAGFDCFLAALQVGPTGRIIGVDMTPEMVAKARANAVQYGFKNITFRLGEIEALPVADETIDVIISNCVINLSPDKEAVFAEAFRVLKPAGRLAISDVVATAELHEEVKGNLDLYAACAAGALSVDELESVIIQAGFIDVQIKPKDESRNFIKEWVPGKKLEEYILSAVITARKPV